MSEMKKLALLIGVVAVLGVLMAAKSATAQAPQPAPETVAFYNCVDNMISTGRFFMVYLSTGDLDLPTSRNKIIVACENQFNAWLNFNRDTYRRDCFRPALIIAEVELEDAWDQRDNIAKWRRNAAKASPIDPESVCPKLR
jgi:hypothetical protein